MEKSLKEVKEELKKAWEECFEMKIEDKLNDKGLEHFWSDDTSEKEAADLLTAGAIDMLLDDMLEDLVGVVIIKGNHNKNEEKDKTDEPDFFEDEEDKKGLFKVFNERTNTFDSKTFKTYNGADDRRTEIALETSAKINELKVVQVFQ